MSRREGSPGRQGRAGMRVGGPLIIWALVLLAGVLLLGRGWFARSRLALGAGLALIAAGVLVMLLRIVGLTGPTVRRRRGRGADEKRR